VGGLEVLVEEGDVAAGHLEARVAEDLLKREDISTVSQELDREAAPEGVGAITSRSSLTSRPRNVSRWATPLQVRASP
jgi:hypothetical protein